MEVPEVQVVLVTWRSWMFWWTRRFLEVQVDQEAKEGQEQRCRWRTLIAGCSSSASSSLFGGEAGSAAQLSRGTVRLMQSRHLGEKWIR